jgi:hypothetical protein
MCLFILKAFKINHIKLGLPRIDFSDHTSQRPHRHVFLLSMFFRQRIQRDGRRARHLDGAKIAVIFITANAQDIAGFKMGFTFVTNGDGFTPGQNVILKALKKVMSFGCMLLFPEDKV